MTILPNHNNASPSAEAVKAALTSTTPIPACAGEEFAAVLRIMTRLRAPDGCPWDRAQSHKSLLKNLVEEAHEFVDTVNNGGDEDMREELGDLLMQVVFHAQIAAERGAFHIGDVARGLADKLVRRHPHVFGDSSAANPEEALEVWNSAKRGEGPVKVSLASVPAEMPALLRARKVQEKASRAGFDWPEAEGAWQKLDEELAELREAYQQGRRTDAAEELGDMLFAVVNVARFIGECPEVALAAAVNKFQRRFNHIETRLAETGRTPEQSTLEEMDAFWEEAKRLK